MKSSLLLLLLFMLPALHATSWRQAPESSPATTAPAPTAKNDATQSRAERQLGLVIANTKKLEADWANCYKGRTGDELDLCLKETAIRATEYYDQYIAYFREVLASQYNGEAKLKAFDKIQPNYLNWRTAQCRLEDVLHRSTVQAGYIRRARCHFRTALTSIRFLNSYID